MSFVKLDITELEFFEKLGGGASGSVYRAKWKTKVVAAKKLLTLDKEPEVLSSLSHRNVVQFFGAVTKAPDYCIITEYAELGCLYDFLRKNSLEYSQILLWAKQIATGMNYLHYEAPIPVIHRDLKSRNVVIAMDLTAKICDFGSSKFHSHTTKMTLVGTFPWMAPEIIQQLPATPACDVYSYSVVLWELLTDEIPFAGLEGMQVAWLVVAKNQRLMVPDTCPMSFSILMKRCWETDPKKRPTFKYILDTLEAMLDNESLKEETDNFIQTKSVWKLEMDAQLKELRLAEKDLSVKQHELDQREKVLKEREKEFTYQLQQRLSTGRSREHPQPHDVSSWSQEDVANWVYHVGGDNELQDYVDLFVKNNISGRRLFLLTGDDLLQIGILSVGHRKELLDEIGKLKSVNYRLLNFPPLPNVPTTSPARPLSITGKEESVCILFGNLYRLQGESYKWKVFLDFEGPQSAIASIKEVTFLCSQTSKGECQTLHKSPFITESWIKKSIGEPIECTITFKDGVVNNPRQTVHTFQLNDSPIMVETIIQLEMVRRERHSSGQLSGITTPNSDTSRTLSPTASVHRLSGIWLDRNQLNPDSFVTITPSESTTTSLSSAQDTLTSSTGQTLQGAWGSANTTAAAMIRKNIGQNILPSHPITPRNSRRGSDTSGSGSSTPQRYPSNNDLRIPLAKPGNPWKPKSSQDLNRCRSSEENKFSDGQRHGKAWPSGRGGKKETGNYYRSVSDNSCAQGVGQRYHQGRGGKNRGTARQPYSEPVHKRK